MRTGGGKSISKPPAILREAGGNAKIKGQRKTSRFPARPTSRQPVKGSGIHAKSGKGGYQIMAKAIPAGQASFTS